MGPALSRVASGVLLSALAIACTGDPLRPSETSESDVATTFAEALVSDDFDAARELVCSSTPDPERQGTFPFEDAEVIGAPSSEVPPDTFIVSTADLYVPFSATENAEEVEGSVEVTFGPDGCVMAYAVSRAGTFTGDDPES